MPFLFILLAFSGKDLVAALKEGDQEAFKELFDKLYDDLYRYLIRRGVDSESCKDLIQQAFISLWESREKLDGSPRALLFRMVINRSANLHRDSKKLSNLTIVDLDSLTDSSYSKLENTELGMQIHAAIQDLPEKRRQVFELCYMSELTYKETAAAMGISVKTVENQMSAALKALRNALKTEE